MTKQNQAERREQEYRRNIRIAAVAALVVVTAGFLAVKPSESKPYAPNPDSDVTLIEPTGPRIFQPPKPPEVVRPKTPVADPKGKATDPSVGRHDWSDTASVNVEPPPLESVPFHKLEVKPKQLHTEVPIYPEACRQVGAEGKLVVKVLVDTLGAASSVEILMSSGNSLLDQAGKDAASKCRFSPGRQRDRPVPVWVAISFVFKLQ